jgi:hypothetical protein
MNTQNEILFKQIQKQKMKNMFGDLIIDVFTHVEEHQAMNSGVINKLFEAQYKKHF